MRSALEEMAIKGRAARKAAREMSRLPGHVKDRALLNVADGLRERQDDILASNELDCRSGRDNGLSEALLDRLLLNEERLESMAAEVVSVAGLPDPVGETTEMRTMPNGLRVGKRRVPLGVIGAIYESRPNVTVDISTLCFKAGNAVILRGGKEAINSNAALARLIKDSIADAGASADAVQFIDSTDRDLVGAMLAMKDTIDLMIPRGSAQLISRVASEATMPAITGGVGVCHMYVDKSADIDMAVEIAHNAKVQRPSVCNALDTLIVHSAIGPRFLPKIGQRWADSDVEVHCDRRALSLLAPIDGLTTAGAMDDDWGKEYLSLTAAVKIVDSAEEALEHIETYGSGHTEVIVTEDHSEAMRFLDEVDASAVMVNTSTRFNDGGEFGLGAEVAISTNKLHARGPMGLRELTSYKWTVFGTGQIRNG